MDKTGYFMLGIVFLMLSVIDLGVGLLWLAVWIVLLNSGGESEHWEKHVSKTGHFFIHQSLIDEAKKRGKGDKIDLLEVINNGNEE